MANGFYEQNFQGRAGQTARADHVSSELKGVTTGFDMVEEITKRVVRGASGESLAALPPAAARAGMYLRFNALGQPEVVQTGFTWRGAHVTGTAYQAGDVVTYGPYGSLYICRIAHTSVAVISDSGFQIMIDLTGINVIRNQIRTGSFTAVPGGDYMVDSRGGNVVVTLPTVASINDSPINITHVAGTLAAGQAITIARNGHLIMGLAENLEIDAPNTSVSLMYANTALGWRLRVLA